MAGSIPVTVGVVVGDGGTGATTVGAARSIVAVAGADLDRAAVEAGGGGGGGVPDLPGGDVDRCDGVVVDVQVVDAWGRRSVAAHVVGPAVGSDPVTASMVVAPVLVTRSVHSTRSPAPMVPSASVSIAIADLVSCSAAGGTGGRDVRAIGSAWRSSYSIVLSIPSDDCRRRPVAPAVLGSRRPRPAPFAWTTARRTTTVPASRSTSCHARPRASEMRQPCAKQKRYDHSGASPCAGADELFRLVGGQVPSRSLLALRSFDLGDGVGGDQPMIDRTVEDLPQGGARVGNGGRRQRSFAVEKRGLPLLDLLAGDPAYRRVGEVAESARVSRPDRAPCDEARTRSISGRSRPIRFRSSVFTNGRQPSAPVVLLLAGAFGISER